VKILVRKNQKKKWEHLSQTKYSEEADLRGILLRDSKVVPTADILPDLEPAPIELMLKEVYLPSSGSVDLLGIDTNGSIYIIETKLFRNPQLRREVIGQVLEYAAFLEGQSINWLEGIVEKQTKGKLAQNFETVTDWDRENFLQNLQENLESGTFRLLIVVDEMNVALQKTINSMNSKGWEIYALELRYFNDKKGTEILVPSVHAEKKPVIQKPQGYWTKEKFFEEADRIIPDEKTRQTLRDLFEFANQPTLGKVEFGKGRKNGTFSLSLEYKDSWVKLFTISYDPQFTWFSFAPMVRKGVNKELILGYIRELKTLGFELDEESIERYPTFDVSFLNDKGRFDRFKKYCITLRNALLSK